MKTLKELVKNYYQKRYNLDDAEANDKADNGVIELIEQGKIAHSQKNHKGEMIRYVYVNNLDELILVDTQIKNDDEEWVKLII